jgi:hypothetical protein
MPFGSALSDTAYPSSSDRSFAPMKGAFKLVLSVAAAGVLLVVILGDYAVISGGAPSEGLDEAVKKFATNCKPRSPPRHRRS